MSQPQRDRSRVSSAPSSKPGTEAAGGPRHFLAAATATAAAPVPPHSPPRPTHGHTPSLFRTRSSCGTAARSSITAPDPRPPPTPKPLQDGAPGRAPPLPYREERLRAALAPLPVPAQLRAALPPPTPLPLFPPESPSAHLQGTAPPRPRSVPLPAPPDNSAARGGVGVAARSSPTPPLSANRRAPPELVSIKAALYFHLHSLGEAANGSAESVAHHHNLCSAGTPWRPPRRAAPRPIGTLIPPYNRPFIEKLKPSSVYKYNDSGSKSQGVRLLSACSPFHLLLPTWHQNDRGDMGIVPVPPPGNRAPLEWV